MAILQALLSLLGRSVGKLLNAVFGWAVTALFGRTSPREQWLLSAVVAAAAAWPLLLLGIVVPRVATFLLAFVPLSRHAPTGILRAIWIALALTVPLLLGVVLARRRAAHASAERTLVRVLRGFPITLGIATAFVLVFVIVPALRLASVARRRRDEHVPCVIDGDAYAQVVGQIEAVIRDQAVGAVRRPPPWWLTAPGAILRALGGRALEGYLPRELAYWKGPAIEIALYPSDALVRGAAGEVAWVHGALVEALARGPALQTFDAPTQELERRLHRIWAVLDDPGTPRGSAAQRARLGELVRELGRLRAPYDSWQVVYRQALQLARALDARPQLLAGGDAPAPPVPAPPVPAPHAPVLTARAVGRAGGRPLAEVPTVDLLRRVVADARELVQKELALAKAELREDKAHELRMAKGLAVGVAGGLATLDLLLVSAVLALAQRLPGWIAALVIAAPVAIAATIAGVVGWSLRVRTPLEKTRKTLEEDVRWMRERTA